MRRNGSRNERKKRPEKHADNRATHFRNAEAFLSTDHLSDAISSVTLYPSTKFVWKNT